MIKANIKFSYANKHFTLKNREFESVKCLKDVIAHYKLVGAANVSYTIKHIEEKYNVRAEIFSRAGNTTEEFRVVDLAALNTFVRGFFTEYPNLIKKITIEVEPIE